MMSTNLQGSLETLGGCRISPKHLAPITYGEPLPEDRLSRHILKLKSFHPEITNFRNGKLEKMDDATKQQLLSDMNEMLEIRQFKRK